MPEPAGGCLRRGACERLQNSLWVCPSNWKARFMGLERNCILAKREQQAGLCVLCTTVDDESISTWLVFAVSGTPHRSRLAIFFCLAALITLMSLRSGGQASIYWTANCLVCCVKEIIYMPLKEKQYMIWCCGREDTTRCVNSRKRDVARYMVVASKFWSAWTSFVGGGIILQWPGSPIMPSLSLADFLGLFK